MKGEEHEHLRHYAEQLTDRLVQVVEQALENRQPARLELARGKVGFAANRRVLTDGKWSGFGAVPDAPVDHELAVLKVTGEDGKLLAVLANYACHNTTLRGDFPQIHGDWAACAQQYIETDQPGTLAMISIGCGADADPYPHGTVELCQQHGRELANEVARLLLGPWTPIAPTIAAQQRILEIPWQQNPDMEAARQAAGQSYLVNALLGKLDEGIKPTEPHTYPMVTWTFADDLAMVFLSNEVVVDYAIRLQREFDPHRLWVTAYTNAVTTYIVSPRLIQEGGYESNNSLSSLVTFGQPEKLDPPMLERIVGTVKEMLPETFRKPTNVLSPSVQMQFMRPGQLEAAARKFPVVYVPFGLIEWHGKHLPLGNDALKAHAILVKTAERFGGAVYPPIYFHEGFGKKELVPVLSTLFARLKMTGFRVIIGVSGHNVQGQIDMINQALEPVVADGTVAGNGLWEITLSQGPESATDHAAKWETSNMMFLYPDTVAMAELGSGPLAPNMKAPDGIGGLDPRVHASAEVGRRNVELAAEAIGKKAKQLLESLPPEQRSFRLPSISPEHWWAD